MRTILHSTDRLASALLIVSCVSGCLGFERDWKNAASMCPRDNLEGRWEGEWLSHHNGHNGRLRAIVTRQCNGTYNARWHATFLGVIPFTSETQLRASQSDEGVHRFSGSKDLGHLAGGLYRYNGWANGCRFESTYRAEKDHGVYSMQRVTRQ